MATDKVTSRNNDETVDYIAGVIGEELARDGNILLSIVLFGSRARGEARSGSDWDFLAITDRKLSRQKKMDLWLRISRRLSERSITADVVIKTQEEFQREKSDTGRVAYYAAKDGVPL